MLFFIHHLMKFSCATVVCISLDVPGTVYDILDERQNGSKSFLLYPSKLDLYAPVSYTHLTLPTNREV